MRFIHSLFNSHKFRPQLKKSVTPSNFWTKCALLKIRWNVFVCCRLSLSVAILVWLGTVGNHSIRCWARHMTTFLRMARSTIRSRLVFNLKCNKTVYTNNILRLAIIRQLLHVMPRVQIGNFLKHCKGK